MFKQTNKQIYINKQTNNISINKKTTVKIRFNQTLKKIDQITPPCWLCHAYFKVSNILYYVSLSYSIYITKRSMVCNSIIILLYLRET